MLSDYRVLDLTDERGALCGQLLADLGADVLKIEPPGGSPMRASLAWTVHARNCRSIALDVQRERGRLELADLLADADLLIAHEEPVAGQGIDALLARHPRLVIATIT